MSDRIPTELFVTSNIRACQAQGMNVYVAHKGDAHSGMILLKIVNKGFQCRLFGQMRDVDGALKWFDRLQGATVSESEADQMVKSVIVNDPDIWVIEIETPDGENPFEGKSINLA